MPVAPSWAARYIGIPFKEDGTGFDGINCWHLIRLAAREQFGLDYPEPAVINPLDMQEVGTILRRAKAAPPWREVTLAEARPPDVIAFKVLAWPSHVGLFINPQWFLHIRQGTASVLGRLDSIIWRNRVDGVFGFEP
jgi:cell wall-associated NlpC family hydrolase